MVRRGLNSGNGHDVCRVTLITQKMIEFIREGILSFLAVLRNRHISITGHMLEEWRSW